MNKKNDGFLNFAVVGAAIILFAKTADVLSYFSPTILNDVIGFDVSRIYGAFCAFLVEGVALALHFNRRAVLSSAAQLVKWSLLGISGICQVFDGFVITETLAGQTDTMKMVFQYGVPLIPLLIMVMIFGIGHLPEVDEKPKPFVGLKNLPGQYSWIWNGVDQKPAKPAQKPIQQYQVPQVVYPVATEAVQLKEVDKSAGFTEADRPES